MKAKRARLALNRETLRLLEDGRLRQVHGGEGGTGISVPTACLAVLSCDTSEACPRE